MLRVILLSLLVSGCTYQCRYSQRPSEDVGPLYRLEWRDGGEMRCFVPLVLDGETMTFCYRGK